MGNGYSLQLSFIIIYYDGEHSIIHNISKTFTLNRGIKSVRLYPRLQKIDFISFETQDGVVVVAVGSSSTIVRTLITMEDAEIEAQFSEVSDDSLTDDEPSLQVKPSHSMKQRLDIKMRMQNKRRKNDIRKSRRIKRAKDIKAFKENEQARRETEEKEKLRDAVSPEEKVVILEKRVNRLQRNLDISQRMMTGNQKLVTKLTQKCSLLERETTVHQQLTHQAKSDLQAEQQARAREAIFVHRCAFAERELASSRAQARRFQKECDRLKGELERKDKEITTLTLGLSSTEQLVRVGEDEVRRKDECLLDLEKVVEKLSSNLSQARQEATSWEIEHKYLQRELLQLQGLYAKSIVNNPLATASDRSQLCTSPKRKKAPRILKMQSKVGSRNDRRTGRNHLAIANTSLSRSLSRTDIMSSSSMCRSVTESPLAATVNIPVTRAPEGSKDFFDQKKTRMNLAILSEADEVSNTASSFPSHPRKGKVFNRRPQSADMLYLGLSDQSVVYPDEYDKNRLQADRPASAMPVLPSKHIFVSTERPGSAYSGAPSVSSNSLNPREDSPDVESQYTISRPTSAVVSVKSFASSERPSSATSRPTSAISRPTSAISRPTSAVASVKSFASSGRPSSATESVVSNASYERQDVFARADDMNMHSPGQLQMQRDGLKQGSAYEDIDLEAQAKHPPQLGDLSTTSVLGPLPNINSKRNSRVRPTSASNRDKAIKPSRRRRPVSAQARTPVRQQKFISSYSQSVSFLKDGSPDFQDKPESYSASSPSLSSFGEESSSAHQEMFDAARSDSGTSAIETISMDSASVRKTSAPRENGHYHMQAKENFENQRVDVGQEIAPKALKSKRANKRKKKRRSRKSGSRYVGRGLGFRKLDRSVPSIFGGGSMRHLVKNIVKKLDPLALQSASSNAQKAKSDMAKRFLGKKL
jgi:hypothetical protein